MSKPNKQKRERYNTRFTSKHPEVPKNKNGKASKTAWSKMKK